MTLTPVSRWAGMPAYFNERAANAVYDTIAKMDDDTAEVFSDMLIGACFQYDCTEHADVIEKAFDDYLDVHGDRLRESLLRTYVSKRAAGEPIDGMAEAAELISKDSPQERAERARRQQRGLSNGQFVTMHRTINYDLVDERGRSISAADDREAKLMGVATPKEALAARGEKRKAKQQVRLGERERTLYQQAYAQIQGMVAPSQRRNQGDHFLHLHYPEGEEIHPLPQFGQPLPLHPRRELLAASVSKLPKFEDMDSYDTLSALGVGMRQSFPLSTDAEGNNAGTERIQRLGANLRANDDLDRAGNRVMSRLGAVSTSLDEMFQREDGSSMLPRRTQAALRAGKAVGIYGPEAMNVIGPTADKAAYRYRGTERKPDRRLLLAFESLHRSPNISSTEQRREVAIHGIETDQGWRPSGLLSYFRSRLPKAELNTLQRKSGVIPPSEGIVIDAKGKVVTQAVGYGDDHYLPFDLKNLKALRGGEYIRTRTYGGPTTEDIYTGLIAGAQSVSVVSRNGVYTVEFDKEFKGKRRYNDKAARMVARYGYLLDAVKNGEITTGEIDPAKHDEIDAMAASVADPDLESLQYKMERERLLSRERRNPTLSAGQRQAAAQEFLNQEALKHKTSDGHELTGTELIDDWVTHQALSEAQAARQQGQADLTTSRARDLGGISREVEGPRVDGRTAPRSVAEAKADIARTHGLNLSDPGMVSENAIRAMGLQEQYARHLERTERTYRDSLKPLQLNGPGYEMALQALQEQFPYYIKSVDYHPWDENRNAKDTGYVNPKANRPADALSGYFAEGLPGKVYADSTRGQARPGATANRAYQKPADALRAAADKLAESAGNAGLTMRGGAPISAANAREIRIEADRKMIEHLRTKTHFGGGLNGGTEHPNLVQAANKPLTDHRGEVQALSTDLHDILWGDRSKVDGLLDTPEGADQLHAKIKRAIAAVDNYKMFDLGVAERKDFAAEGKSPEARKIDRADVGLNLRAAKGGQEFEFGAAYRQGTVTDPDRMKATYVGDQHHAALVTLGAPASLDADDFTAKMDQVHTKLEARQKAIVEWERRGGNLAARPAEATQLPLLVEGYARAVQLRRRFDEAADAEKAKEEEKELVDAHQPIGFTSAGGGIYISVGQEPAASPPAGGVQPSAGGGTFTPLSPSAAASWTQGLMKEFDSL